MLGVESGVVGVLGAVSAGVDVVDNVVEVGIEMVVVDAVNLTSRSTDILRCSGQ